MNPWEQDWSKSATTGQAASVNPWEQDWSKASEPQAAVPEERGFLQEAGRSASMLGLEAVKGATNLVMLPADALNDLINIVRGKTDLTDPKNALRMSDNAPSRPLTEAISSVQPQPENGMERFATRVSGALGGAAGGIGLGRAIPGVVGETLAAAPGTQAVAAGTGSSAAHSVAESGGGEVAQTVAGLVGGAAGGLSRYPVAQGIKRSFRGGEEGRQTVAENIKTFEDATGRTPTVGQATENRRTQAAESLLSRAPGGAGVMAKNAEGLADDFGAGIETKAATLSPKASGEQAGRSINRGISDAGGFVDTFKSKSGQLYSEIDKHIKPDSPVQVSNTQNALAELTKITKGAEATTSRLVNKRIAEIEADLKADAKTGTIPYEALKAIRTRVGQELADGALQSDVPTAQWKRLYGALSADLEAAAKNAGPKAEQAYKRANNYYSAGSKRLEILQSVVDKNGGPEAIFRAATSGNKEGATTLRAVMQSLPTDSQKTVSATVLRRLGRSKPGQQDDIGEAFSTETFLTNWNSMSPEAKAVLFNRYGPSFRADMDKVAKVAANLREGSQVFRNPSGTAQAGIQYSTIGAFVISLANGNFKTAGAIATGVTGSNLSARLLTHPPFVKWLAEKTNRPIEAMPALLNQLAQSKDPVLQEAAEVLKQGQNQQNN